DPAADRRVDVRHRLDRLHHGDALARAHGVARGGKLHEDHVPQLVLGVVRDADPGQPPVFQPEPLVFLGVLQFLGIQRKPSLRWVYGRGRKRPSTTRARRSLPRMSTEISAPASRARAAGTYPMPISFSSVGENEPLVTQPTSRPWCTMG